MIQTAALPPLPVTSAATTSAATQGNTKSAGAAFAPQISFVPAPTDAQSLAAMKVPMLRPGSAELPGVSDGVVAVAVDSKRFWGVQVGAFSRYSPAHLAAVKAQQNLPFQIKDIRVAVDEADGHSGKLYRARLVGLAQDEAADACRELRARQIPCLVVQANTSVAMIPAP